MSLPSVPRLRPGVVLVRPVVFVVSAVVPWAVVISFPALEAGTAAVTLAGVVAVSALVTVRAIAALVTLRAIAALETLAALTVVIARSVGALVVLFPGERRGSG